MNGVGSYISWLAGVGVGGVLMAGAAVGDEADTDDQHRGTEARPLRVSYFKDAAHNHGPHPSSAAGVMEQ